jgi:hypothetical protein
MSDSLEWDDDEHDATAPFTDEELDALRNAPVDVIVCNHLYHMLQLATVHLSATPPRLAEAQLLIDGVRGLFDAVGTRLGQPQDIIREALTQVQLVFVQVSTGYEPTE